MMHGAIEATARPRQSGCMDDPNRDAGGQRPKQRRPGGWLSRRARGVARSRAQPRALVYYRRLKAACASDRERRTVGGAAHQKTRH
jgi:hypothetical protein